MVGKQRVDPGRLHAELAGQQREHRAHLHLAEAGQLCEPRPQVLAALGLAPDARGVAAVALLEERAQGAHALGHRTGEPVQRGALAEHGGELLGVARRDARAVEVPEAGAQLERPGERLLDGDLLIECEADEERERVGGDEPVGLVVAGEGQALGSGCDASHVGRVPT